GVNTPDAMTSTRHPSWRRRAYMVDQRERGLRQREFARPTGKCGGGLENTVSSHAPRSFCSFSSWNRHGGQLPPGLLGWPECQTGRLTEAGEIPYSRPTALLLLQ